MTFNIFDIMLVGASAVFGAGAFVSPGGAIGAAVGAGAAILTVVMLKRFAKTR